MPARPHSTPHLSTPVIRLLALSLLLAGAASAQITNGAALPLADQTLTAVDGSSLSLVSAAGEEGLVVLFWSNTCPWTDRYAERVADLVRVYVPAGFGVVLVNSNDPGEDESASAEASRDHAATLSLAVPYIVDADGALAAAFGAESTPHAFFFGPARTLLYEGAIDDGPADVSRVQVPYLRQAMDQSVAGLPIEVKQTRALGCKISRAGQ